MPQPIFIISTKGKSKQQLKDEAHAALDKYRAAQAKTKK